jgi:hypothetical protein
MKVFKAFMTLELIFGYLLAHFFKVLLISILTYYDLDQLSMIHFYPNFSSPFPNKALALPLTFN